MIKLTIALTILIIFLTVSLSFSQESDSISLARRKAQDENTTVNAKANYISLSSVGGGAATGIGLVCELQIKSSERISFLVSVNPIFKAKDRIEYYTTHISAGTKFYFEKEADFRGYLSLNAGILLGGDGLFAFSPALGFEYKIDKGLRFNLEAKPIISLLTYFSIGAGLSFSSN